MLLSAADRFAKALSDAGLPPLRRRRPTTLQVNLGKLCNQACHHCHVDAGPTRTEQMDAATVGRVLDVLGADPGLVTLDVTGGAPELNPHFRALVDGARALGRDVIVRCNLTVLAEPGQEDTPEFFASRKVTVTTSLPCYTADNVDAQRGGGVFASSLDGLRKLNAVGYGAAEGRSDEQVLADNRSGLLDPPLQDPLRLNLVYNPLGPALPPDQGALERDYRARLAADFGIRFDRLYALANMPIHRFAQDLERQGRLDEYSDTLAAAFNADAVDAVMCRDLVSVDWDGTLADCDFHQMLGVALGARAATADGARPRASIFDRHPLAGLDGAPITTADHCLGCTAGAGSSCGGALAPAR